MVPTKRTLNSPSNAWYSNAEYEYTKLSKKNSPFHTPRISKTCMCMSGVLMITVLGAVALLFFINAVELVQDEADIVLLESLRAHKMPEWFAGAKLGIFIHWGVYSVPAWAPLTRMTLEDQTSTSQYNCTSENGGMEGWFKCNPYAEWYANTQKIEGSPTAEYHNNTYGSNFKYGSFAPQFEEASAGWRAADWAALFAEVGARYSVLTTKHHDGFCLWPTSVSSPTVQTTGFGGIKNMSSSSTQDLVGHFTDAMRAAGIRVGLYYSGGLDWHFKGPFAELQGGPVVDNRFFDSPTGVPEGDEYARYADSHWEELIARYQPDILWNDIGYPREGRWIEFANKFYKNNSQGVINDRFGQCPQGQPTVTPECVKHSDFDSPEYKQLDNMQEKKWETCRGVGYSFGYNRAEGEEDYIGPRELIHMFVDIVAKNGNLLLDVGPDSTGAIPELQVSRLQGLGRWLSVNGKAIFDTEPMWNSRVCCATTDKGEKAVFTRKKEAANPNKYDINAIILGELDTYVSPAGANKEFRLSLCPSPLAGLQHAEQGAAKLLGAGGIEASGLSWLSELVECHQWPTPPACCAKGGGNETSLQSLKISGIITDPTLTTEMHAFVVQMNF